MTSWIVISTAAHILTAIKRPVLLFLFALILITNIPSRAAESNASTARLLYTVPIEIDFNLLVTPGVPYATKPYAIKLMTLDSQGNESLLSPMTLDGDELYLSPDGTKIASRSLDQFSHNLIVLDAHGVQLVNYQFDPVQDGLAEEWYLWGWKGTGTLVLVHFLNDQLKFYEFDLLSHSQGLQALPRLSDFSVWSISFLIDSFHNFVCLCDLFEYSPTFRYVVTPFLPTTSRSEYPKDPDASVVWDLQSGTSTVIAGTAPWWLDAHAVWPPSEDYAVLEMYGDSGYGLYTYDYQNSPKIFSPLNCGSENCEPRSLIWDPSGTHLAFWLNMYITPRLRSGSQLVIVDAKTHYKQVLLSSTSSVHDLKWSPDGQLIAFAEYSPDTYEPQGIKVIDPQTGDTLEWHSLDEMNDFLGYLTT